MQFRAAHQVATPFIVASIIMLGLTVWVSWTVHARNRELTKLVSEDIDNIQAAQELAIGAREIRTQLTRYLATRDARHLEAVPALEQQAATWLGRARENLRTDSGRELLDEIQIAFEQFQVDFPAATKLASRERWRAIDDIKGQFDSVIVDRSRRFMHQKQELVQQTAKLNEQFADRLILALVGLTTCGIASGALMGSLVSNSLRKTVVSLSVPIHDTAGKLSQVVGPIDLRSARNFDEIQGNLTQMAEQVAVVVERLQQSQREALRAEQLAAVGQMAAGMAHELRNPLTSVKILVQSASERRSLNHRDINVLEQEITRLELLIQSFLEFARPPMPEKRRLDLCEVVQNCVEAFHARAERVAIHVSIVAPDTPLWVLGDSTQLHQLLLNLLVNALDAVGRDGEIIVEAAEVYSKTPGNASKLVRLSVIDDGCGLPSNLGHRIFDPFVSSKQTGIGMGLSICRRIVESHGGTITAADHSPRGTILTVQLPMIAAPQLALAAS